MAVVVVELEIVGFVVFGVVEIHPVAAVAEGADQVVAIVRAAVLVREAADAADVGVFFADGIGGDGGDEAGAEAEAEKGELPEAMHFRLELLIAM